MKIGIEPISGLGNRLRVIDSTLAFAEQFDTDITLYWKLSSALNCSYDLLFERDSRFEVKEYRSFINDGGRMDKICNKFYPLLFRDKMKGYEKHLFYTDIVNLKKSNFDFNDLYKYKSVYIQSFTDFYRSNKTYLVPKEYLRDKVQKIVENRFSADTIGLHVRRTDNLKAIEKSPDALFFQKMEEELSKNPGTNFFLSTDSMDTEKMFIKKFKDKIITNQKVNLRNKPEGIVDAYLDMLCLSRTQKIYGSYFSSFSEYSAKLGNIKLATLTKDLDQVIRSNM